MSRQAVSNSGRTLILLNLSDLLLSHSKKITATGREHNELRKLHAPSFCQINREISDGTNIPILKQNLKLEGLS